jgi:hypothetical protein
MNIPTPLDKEKFLACIGKRVVYRETGYLVPATITDICLEPTFEVTLTAVEGITLASNKSIPPFKVVFGCAAAWPYLCVAQNRWSFSMPGCCWSICLDEPACDVVVRLSKEKARLDPDVVFKLADMIYKFPQIKEIPNTLQQLREQIRKINEPKVLQ